MTTLEELNALKRENARTKEDLEILERRVDEANGLVEDKEKQRNDIERLYLIIKKKIDNLNMDKMMSIQMEANGLLHFEIIGPWTLGDWNRLQRSAYETIRQNQIDLKTQKPPVRPDVDMSDAMMPEPADEVVEVKPVNKNQLKKRM